MSLLRTLVAVGWSGLAVFSTGSPGQDRRPSQTIAELRDIRAMAFTGDSRYLVTAEESGKVSYWDLSTMKVAKSAQAGPNPIIGKSTPEPDSLVDAGRKAVLVQGDQRSLWDIETSTAKRNFQRGRVWVAPDARFVAVRRSLSQDLSVIRTSNGEPVSVLAGDSHNEFVNVAFSHDGHYVATGGHQGALRLWDLASGEPLRELRVRVNQGVSVIAFSPDGTRLIAGHAESGGATSLGQWDSATGAQFPGFSAEGSGSVQWPGWVSAVAYSADGRWLIGGFTMGPVVVWDASTGSVACKFDDFGISNIGGIDAVGISPDSRFAFAKQGRHAARVWDLSRCLVGYAYELQIATEEVNSPLFAPKGEFEPTQKFTDRLAEAMAYRDGLIKKYAARLNADLQAQADERSRKINASVTQVQLPIDGMSLYDPDKQLFTVTIRGAKEVVRVPLSDAPEFKAGIQKARASAGRRLASNLVAFEYFNIQIINPVSSKKYPFGRQEPFPGAAVREAEERRISDEREAQAESTRLSAELRGLESVDCEEVEIGYVVAAPSERTFVLSPRRACWTPWLVVGPGGAFGGTSSTGDHLIQFVYVDGTVGEFEDGPTKNNRLRSQVGRVRFKSLGRAPVTIMFKVE